MIPKELLSTVLDQTVESIRDQGLTNGIDYTTDEDDVNNWYYINIYELAHLVKEWAFNNNYVIKSGKEGNHTIEFYSTEILDKFNRHIISLQPKIDDTEPDAIFAAGEWVLEQLKE